MCGLWMSIFSLVISQVCFITCHHQQRPFEVPLHASGKFIWSLAAQFEKPLLQLGESISL